MSASRPSIFRGTLLPLLAASVLAVAACGGASDGAITPPVGGGTGGGGGGGTAPVVTTSVTMSGSAFTPPDIQVSPGATVTFTNNDGIQHNVTFSNATVGGVGNFTTGTRTVTAPSTAGTYAFTCTNHSGMNGTMKVQ